MKKLLLWPAPQSFLAITACLILLAIGAFAEEGTKIDLEEAKAELAKAKSAGQASEESEAEKPEKKPLRSRLFSRSHRDKEKGREAEEVQEEEEIKPEPQETVEAPEERKVRFRLFGRGQDEDEQEADTEESTPQEEVVPDSGGERQEPVGADQPRKKFSPFARLRNRDNEKDVGQVPSQESKVAAQPEERKAELAANTEAVASAPAPEPPLDEDSERKRLFGGLFAKGTSSEPAENPGDAVEEEEAAGESRGSLFDFFRSKDEKQFARADKTKLGKSVEGAAAASSTPPGKEKIKGGGELGWYVVTEEEVPFYAIGPGQPMPPEKMLDRGSLLTVTKGGWGWCNVKLGSGELGVVSTKAMRPATVAEISRNNRGSATASKGRGSRSLFNILSRGTAPKLDLPSRKSSEAPIRNFGLLPPIDSGN